MVVASSILETQRRGLTVENFLRMAQAGILQPNERIELIQGELIEMTPIGRRHVWGVHLLDQELHRQLDEKYPILVQSSLELDEESCVQPDIAVLRPGPKSINDPLPRPEDVLLLIEVADSSLRLDREAKVPLYASHAISEVWVIDVEAQRIFVYRNLLNGLYSTMEECSPGSRVSPAMIAEFVLDVADFFNEK